MNGQRRAALLKACGQAAKKADMPFLQVNYYVKHLIQDAEGHFNQALAWIVEGKERAETWKCSWPTVFGASILKVSIKAR